MALTCLKQQVTALMGDGQEEEEEDEMYLGWAQVKLIDVGFTICSIPNHPKRDAHIAKIYKILQVRAM